MHTTWGQYYWPVFLGVLALALLGPEIYALVTNPHNTLSDWVWTELHVTKDSRWWNWSAAQFLTFGCWCVVVFWLTWHFWFYRFR